MSTYFFGLILSRFLLLNLDSRLLCARGALLLGDLAWTGAAGRRRSIRLTSAATKRKVVFLLEKQNFVCDGLGIAIVKNLGDGLGVDLELVSVMLFQRI
jgi:hypothetical protein